MAQVKVINAQLTDREVIIIMEMERWEREREGKAIISILNTALWQTALQHSPHHRIPGAAPDETPVCVCVHMYATRKKSFHRNMMPRAYRASTVAS